MSSQYENTIQYSQFIRQQWLPIEIAVREVVTFERRFGMKHLLLAYHAALPFFLTPELLNLLNLNFLGDEHVPWIAEVDFLLSPLCHQIDDHIYQIEPSVREVLLVELEEKFEYQRLMEISAFLLAYQEKKPRWEQRLDILRTQRCIALAYLDPDQGVKEMTALLEESLSPEKAPLLNLQGQLQVINTMEIVAEPLEQTSLKKEYHSLTHNSRILADMIYKDMKGVHSYIVQRKSDIDEETDISEAPSTIRLKWITTEDVKGGEVVKSMIQNMDTQTLLYRAHLLLEEGQNEAALSVLKGLRTQDEMQQRDVAYLLGWCYIQLKRWDDAIRTLSPFLEHTHNTRVQETLSERERLALYLLRLGVAAVNLAHYEDASYHFTMCLKMLRDRRVHLPVVRIQARYYLAMTCVIRGFYSAAIQHYEEALRLCRQYNNEEELPHIYHGLCDACRYVGDFIKADMAGREALRLYQKQGDQQMEARIHYKLGRTRFLLSDFKEAADHYTESLALATSYNGPTMATLNCATLADLRLTEGHLPEAKRYCQLALEVMERTDDTHTRGSTYRVIGKVTYEEAQRAEGARRRELLEETVVWLQKSCEHLSLTQAYPDIAEVYGQLAQALEELERVEEAIECWRSGYEIQTIIEKYRGKL